jgi:hypothetical protein
MTQQDRTWLVVLVVAVLLVLIALAGIGREPNAPLGQRADRGTTQRDVGGLVPELWLSGVAGGVVVFALTTVTSGVVRTRQRRRELRGLSRVLRPEMERNSKKIGILAGPGGFSRHTYLSEPPTRATWLDTRVRLSELMQEDDFAILAKFYAALELLETAVVTPDAPLEFEIRMRLDEAAEHGDSAMQVVERYCSAQWWPFKGLSPGPTEASTEAQEGLQRPWWRRVFGA